MAGWTAPGKSRERIFTFGLMGTWKSCGLIDIAKRIDGQVYVIDTDNSWGMILERLFPEVENVTVVDASGMTWAEIDSELARIWKKVTVDDWVGLDSMSGLWDLCIDYFSEQITGKDLPTYLTAWRGRRDKGGSQEGLIDAGLYDYVNPAWHKTISRAVKSARCHVYMTAEANEIGPRIDKTSKQMYGDFGLKPRTQKSVGFNAATVLLLDKDKMGRPNVSMIKSWGNEDKWGGERDVQYESFAKLVLFEKGGWRPVRKVAT